MFYRNLFSVLFLLLALNCTFDDTDSEQIILFSVVSDVKLNNSFETVEKDYYSNYNVFESKDVFIFKNYNEFNEFYRTLLGGQNCWPDAPLVDFSKFRVIAIVDEAKPTAGFDAEIFSIKITSGNQYDVSVRFTSPGDDETTTQGTTKPFHIVKTAIQ